MADLASPHTAPAAAPAEGPIPTPGGPLSYIHWGPVVAGSIAAAAVWFVLMAFATSVGLATMSPSPTWRDASIALALLSGLWLLLTALGSFGLGGYLAGRVRSSWATSEDEVEFRDGTHGLLVWALAVVIGAVLTWATATALTSISAGSTTVLRANQGEPAFLSYELDRLFRSERRPETADPQARSEAARIIMTGIGRRDIASDDRAYLVRLVAARTGLGQADADRRVAEVSAQARRAARRARASSVIIGFMTAASLAAGAAAAWFAAGIGGRHRDRAISPPLRWSWRRTAVTG
jgi:hypothetical protein